MPFNGSGVYNRVHSWGTDRDAGVKIQADRMDAEDDSIATAFSNCVTRDGQSPATADVPMGGFKHTGVANATARTNYGAVGQVQDGSFIWGGTTGGVADAYTASVSPPITAYAAGQKFAVIVSAANTGASTINFNSLGAKSITKKGATALAAGDLPINAIALLQYDGTQFQLLNVATVQTADIADGAATTAKLADNAVTLAKMEHGTQGDVLYYAASGAPTRLTAGTAGQFLKTNGAAADPAWAQAGGLIQTVNTLTGAVATGTTAMALDDTIPQNTEGTEFITLVITPTDTNSKLEIEVVFCGSNSLPDTVIAALFQDSTADALATCAEFVGAAGGLTHLKFTHHMTAGTTSATTFKVRAGAPTGTITFNGVGGARRFGGVMASSITIREIAA